MTRRCLPIAVLCLVTTTSQAATKLLIVPTTLTDNQYLYRPGSYTRNAITLPAGKALLGISPETTTIISDPSITSVSVTGNPTISFNAVNGPNNDTITRSSGSWVADGFTVGHAIWVDGAGSASNNVKDGYVASVMDETLTLIAPVLATENVGASMTGSPSLTFSEEGATGDKITRGPMSGSWIDDGFKAGMEITITGTASNNVTDAYVVKVSNTDLTLGPTDLTAETTSSATIVGRCRVRGVPNFVQTANFNTASAVEAGPVSGLTLDGNVVTSFDDNTEYQAAPVAYGAFIDAQHAIISDNVIKGFRGYAAGVQTSNTTGALNMGRVDRNFIQFCWSGIRLRHGDMSASQNVVTACRDYGIHASGGTCRLTDNHCYGMARALFLDDADNVNSANDMYADSQYGIYSPASSDMSSFTNTRLYHNYVRGALFAGTVNTLISPQVDVPNSSATVPWPDKVGIELSGASNTILGGLITLDGVTQAGHDPVVASTAVRVSGSNCRIKNLVMNDLDSLDDSRGLHIPVNSGIVGGEFEYRIYGFENPGGMAIDDGDAALDIDDANLVGVTITIIGNSKRSPGFVYNDAVQYVDVPSGWGVGGSKTGTPTLTFEADDGTITRNDTGSGGSWISDGFNIGETVTITGTASNNVSGAAITGVTASVLTLGTTNLVDESDSTNTVTSANGTTITIKDEASGQSFSLTPGTAY